MTRPKRSATERRLIEGLVRRAAETEAPVLATELRRYAASEGLSWEDLARTLGATSEDLYQVALCRPPRSEHFVEDVATIAASYVDADRLLVLLRQIQVLGVLTGLPAQVPRHQAGAIQGMLLAARDKEENEERTLPGDTSRGTETDAEETRGMDDDAGPPNG